MARRGENIRKRSDGRWEGRYIKGRSADGKPCWGYVYGTTYTEVRAISARKRQSVAFITWIVPILLFGNFRAMVIFCPARCKRVNFLALPVYSAALSPACFRGFQDKHVKRANFGAGTFGSDNTSQRKAKGFRGNHGTGVFIDAAAHLQVCSALSSHSPFWNYGKTAAKSHKVPLPFTTEEQKKLQTFVMESPTSRKSVCCLGFSWGCVSARSADWNGEILIYQQELWQSNEQWLGFLVEMATQKSSFNLPRPKIPIVRFHFQNRCFVFWRSCRKISVARLGFFLAMRKASWTSMLP